MDDLDGLVGTKSAAEVRKALADVLNHGYGKVTLSIVQGQLRLIEVTKSELVVKDLGKLRAV